MVNAYRLPTHVRPRRYDIHLHARVGEPTFRGHVRIALDVARATDVIELHARDLTISRAVVACEGREIEATPDIRASSESIALRLAQRLPEGPAELRIRYDARVSEGQMGLYLSKDANEAMLATQCEETEARSIFPCWDEPAFKAALAWTITTSPDAHVLTNAPLLGKETTDDGTTWRFAPTPPVSTYLAALAIGKLRSSPELRVGDVPLRVWAYEGKERLGAFGNELSAKLLPWYEDYFGQRYAYVKYDQVAVPSFASGAMENAGLVISRQSLLLHDPRTTSFRQETQMSRVIAHEMAHMWFGNLVTMAWWDDIWLNESFAEWVSHKALDALVPHYRVWSEQQKERMHAMGLDALSSTHPIYSPVETPEEATELFDAITYYKGAAVMRMLEAFLGDKPFRAGLRAYMKEFAGANAKGADLWRHLGDASGQPVTRLMESWIAQPGLPVLHASLDGATLRLRQERFLSDPRAKPAGETWVLPVVVRFADKQGIRETRHLLEKADDTIELPRGVRWAHANADAIGFYRVAPDDALLNKLLANARVLKPAEQAALIDDLFALAKRGMVPTERLLDACDGILAIAEDDLVLDVLAARLALVDDLLHDEGDEGAIAAFRAWIQEHVQPRLDEIGASPRPGEDPRVGLRRAALYTLLGAIARNAPVVSAARDLARRERASPSGVDANLVEPAIAIEAMTGDAKTLDAHIVEYTRRRAAGAPPLEAQRYLGSLAEFRDPALVKKVLTLTTTGGMPLEAVGPLVRTMLGKRHARVEAWRHLTANWPWVREKLGDMWTGFLVDRAGHLPTEMRDEFAAFLEANLKDAAQQSIARALESLDQRAVIEPRLRAEMTTWMRRRA